MNFRTCAVLVFAQVDSQCSVLRTVVGEKHEESIPYVNGHIQLILN